MVRAFVMMIKWVLRELAERELELNTLRTFSTFVALQVG